MVKELLHLVSSTVGPYLIKSITSKSSAILEKNPTYWDADNVKISKVKLTYYDGQDSESLIRGFDNGDYTVARVSQMVPTIRV